MIDPEIQPWLDAAVERAIRWFGVYVHYAWTEPEGPSVAYTVGLSDYGHPELAVANLELRRASELLNSLAVQVRAGVVINPYGCLEFDTWPRRVIVEPLEEAGMVLVAAVRRSPVRSAPRAYQLVYDAPGGRFPRYARYDTHAAQPWPGPAAT